MSKFYSLLIAIYCLPVSAFSDTYEDCLARESRIADENLTLKALRAFCSEKTSEPITPIEHRADLEKANRGNRFTITPHKPNYLLPISYNKTPNTSPYHTSGLTDNISNTEIKFQLSLKAPLAYELFNGHGSLWAAYTNTSWWQAYNENSAPFRETNHEPEIFFSFPTKTNVFGMELDRVLLGLSHQSNGRSGSLSRSWNRLYANFLFTKENFVLSLKPWYRLPESEKPVDPVTGLPTSADGDDNPDIYNYMGYGELRLSYKLDRHTLGMMIRNNLRKDNKGAVQLDWSFPINEQFRGYVQYFNGYGESLIDYNAHANRLSIGVMLTDWL